MRCDRSNWHRSLRGGFSLLELLLVIAIGSLLVALLLPAVQAGRETARRFWCCGNLRQLGLAVHSYHEVYKRIPLGAVTRSQTAWQLAKENKGSFFVQLLPYMGEARLYAQLDFTDNVEKSINKSTGRPVHETVLSWLTCPSDNHGDFYPGGGFVSALLKTPSEKKALSNYAPSIGNQALEDPAKSTVFFDNCGIRGNKFGTGPEPFADTADGRRVSGVVSKWAWGTRFREITDGTARTILIGEIRPHCSYQARDGWMNVNSNFFATTIPINYETCPDEAGFGRGYCNFYYRIGGAMGFKSKHPGGAQFVYCDGSVHFLPQDFDYDVYQRLGDRRDGLPTE